MSKDYSREIIEKIAELKSKGFEFGKSERYLKHRTGINFKEMTEELKACKQLVFTEKRKINGEERYTLYFVYSRSKGRVYALTLRSRIRIITVFPLGRRTLSRYHKQRFKKIRRYK